MTTVDHETPDMTATGPATASTPDCPAVTDGGSHSISWHQGGACQFCGAPPAGAGAAPDIWVTALKFTAHHLTAERVRSVAEHVPGRDRAVVLSIANAMADAEAQGMTPEKCYYLASLDKAFGPYISPDRAVHIGAAYMVAGWSSERLPDATRPEVADAIKWLEDMGVTAVTAARFTETGTASLPVPSPRPATGRALSVA